MRKFPIFYGGSFCAFLASLVIACPIQANVPEAEEAVLFEKIPEEEKQIVETVDVVEVLKDKIRYTKHWDEGCSDTTLQISQADAERLLKIATAEAENQGIDGMLKVMQVVINRKNSPDYPGTIEAVITQRGQFEPVSNGTYYTAVPSPEAHLALAKLEANIDPDSEIIAFEASANAKSLEKYFCFAYTQGGHDFYVQKIKN